MPVRLRANRGALARAASRTYYLDPGRLARLEDERATPFTPAVHASHGLAESLENLFRISTMDNLTSQDLNRLLRRFARLSCLSPCA